MQPTTFKWAAFIWFGQFFLSHLLLTRNFHLMVIVILLKEAYKKSG